MGAFMIFLAGAYTGMLLLFFIIGLGFVLRDRRRERRRSFVQMDQVLRRAGQRQAHVDRGLIQRITVLS
jgi:hypothetical protein